jgi:hypothetical protein
VSRPGGDEALVAARSAGETDIMALWDAGETDISEIAERDRLRRPTLPEIIYRGTTRLERVLNPSRMIDGGGLRSLAGRPPRLSPRNASRRPSMTVARFAQVDRGIPRKFSARRGDVGLYDPKMLSYLSDKGVDVFLNGKLLEHVAAWDCDGGFVIRHKHNADGSLCLEDRAPAFETLRGEIEVRWSEGSAA